MKWYLVKIVYRIICGTGDHRAQFDEQLRLISAFDETDAYEKARTIGLNESETFYNQKKQLVCWNFIDVSEIHQLTELIHGAELYSRINEVDDGNAYTDYVKKRAASIKEQPITHQVI